MFDAKRTRVGFNAPEAHSVGPDVMGMPVSHNYIDMDLLLNNNTWGHLSHGSHGQAPMNSVSSMHMGPGRSMMDDTGHGGSRPMSMPTCPPAMPTGLSLYQTSVSPPSAMSSCSVPVPNDLIRRMATSCHVQMPMSSMPESTQTNPAAPISSQWGSDPHHGSMLSQSEEAYASPPEVPADWQRTMVQRRPVPARTQSQTMSEIEALDTDGSIFSEGHGMDDEPRRLSANSSSADAARLMEKRRRRRESHNAVERRRRDNINSQITELATLLPEAMLRDAISTSTQGGNSAAWTFGPDTAVKVAQNRSQFGSWYIAQSSTQSGDKSDTPNSPTESPSPKAEESEAECVPKSSCLRMSSCTSFAATLAPVNADNPALAAAQAKPNKGIILRKSVEYIRQLQQFLDMQMSRNEMLEKELRQLYHSHSSGTPHEGVDVKAETSTQESVSPQSCDLDVRWNIEERDDGQKPSFSTMFPDTDVRPMLPLATDGVVLFPSNV